MVQYSTVHTVQCSAVHTVQCSAVQYRQYSTAGGLGRPDPPAVTHKWQGQFNINTAVQDVLQCSTLQDVFQYSAVQDVLQCSALQDVFQYSAVQDVLQYSAV